MKIKGKTGRPRSFDADAALSRASDLFWTKGLGGTSLDEIGAMAAMKRPSLTNAFGSKEDLYLLALQRYRDKGANALRAALPGYRPLRVELADAFECAIDQYIGAGPANRGCLLIGTASVEAVENPRIRRMLSESLDEFEQILSARFSVAVSQGELPVNADPSAGAMVGMAVLHSLAVKARAGAGRDALHSLAKSGVAAVCGVA